MDCATILIDFHGVLTTGKRTITADGSELFEEVHSRDSRAIRQLCAMGYHVVIFTSSKSKIIEAYAKKVGADLYVNRDKSQHGFKNYIAVGDDSWDIPLLKEAKRAFCPQDAYSQLFRLPNIQVLQTKGGHGVIAELLDILS